MPISRNKFRIIPPGHNFKIGTPPMKGNYLLAVSGWWSDRKNLHTILKVFNKVIKEKKCKITVVGKFFEGKYRIIDEKKGVYTDKYETGEEYKQKIMDLIKKLKLEGHVRFIGIKKGKEIQEVYRRALI